MFKIDEGGGTKTGFRGKVRQNRFQEGQPKLDLKKEQKPVLGRKVQQKTSFKMIATKTGFMGKVF